MEIVTPPTSGEFLEAWRLIWQAVGAIVGTTVALFYSRPKTQSDFWSRAIVSILLGGFGGWLIGEYLGWPETNRHALAGGLIVSLFAYPIIGMGQRVLEKINSAAPKNGLWKPKE